MFIWLLSVWAIGRFGKPLFSNSKGPIKYLTLNNRPFQAIPTLVTIKSDETFLHIYC